MSPLALMPGRREATTIGDLCRLYEMRLEIEKQMTSGPWSDWDGELLQKWSRDVRDAISRCRMELECQEMPSIRERFAAALRDELVVHLNAGEIGSPAFERFLTAMEMHTAGQWWGPVKAEA